MGHTLASATTVNSHSPKQKEPGSEPCAAILFLSGAATSHTSPQLKCSCSLQNWLFVQLHSLLLNLMALPLAMVLYDPTLNTDVVTFQPLFVPRLSLALSSSSQAGKFMLANLYACVFINHDVVLSPNTQVLQI